MTLANLIGRSLEEIEPNGSTIKRLLAAAERNIADAHIEQVSSENRFDAAYKAIMQLANVALQANGFRTLTSVPGHHRTMIQLLGKTVGVDSRKIILLDALRKQRNVSDYTGEVVPNSAMKDCLEQAISLLDVVKQWVSKNRPDLMA
ncbi:MAG: DNA-binding protein [Thiohalomonadales bacterium]